MKRLLLITAAALVGASSWAAPVGTIRSTKGDVKKGTIRWVSSTKSYELKMGNVTVTLGESEVESIDVEKPKNLEKNVLHSLISMLFSAYINFISSPYKKLYQKKIYNST